MDLASSNALSIILFFFKQKTAYEMRISDWSSDVCSSDLIAMGEGGAVTTNDGRLADRLRRLRAHGMVRDAALLQNAELAFDADGNVNPWYYAMPEIGLNYRVTDIHDRKSVV